MNGADPPRPQYNKNLKKQHFVVKVQVPMTVPGGTYTDQVDDLGILAMAIYNKDKSFNIQFFKKGNEEIYNQLFKKITSEGYRGLKGYFHAILEPGDKKANQFRINPENIFVEPW